MKLAIVAESLNSYPNINTRFSDYFYIILPEFLEVGFRPGADIEP